MFDHKSYTEKSLSRMIKAKGKADRAAARQAAANAAASVSGISIDTPISGSAPVTPSADEPPATEVVPIPSSELSQSNSDEVAVANPAAPLDRTDLLKSKPSLVGHFMRLMVPILVDVYAASVITPVRVKTLTGLLKAVSFQDDDGLRRVLEVRKFILICSVNAEFGISVFLWQASRRQSFLPRIIHHLSSVPFNWLRCC